MRGKVSQLLGTVLQLGITPACAGKREPERRSGNAQPDHPRVCGEKHSYLNSTFLNLGSPLRMRGKVLVRNLDLLDGGITPAYAGKSGLDDFKEAGREDHPRVCGEKVGQVWGCPPPPRITPACAGKRSLSFPAPWCWRDHPRVCGEKLCDFRHKQSRSESPPRMRGKGCGDKVKHCFHGITPAYAGKSHRRPWQR